VVNTCQGFMWAILFDFRNCSQLYKCLPWVYALSLTMGGLGTGVKMDKKIGSLTLSNQTPYPKYAHTRRPPICAMTSLAWLD